MLDLAIACELIKNIAYTRARVEQHDVLGKELSDEWRRGAGGGRQHMAPVWGRRGLDDRDKLDKLIS